MKQSDRHGFVLLRADPRIWQARLYDALISSIAEDAKTFELQAEGGSPAPSDMADFRTSAHSAKRASAAIGTTPLFESKNSGQALKVWLTENQERMIREWTSDHGDDFDAVFRSERKVKPRVDAIGVRLKPGQTFSIPAKEVPEELRGGVLDLASPRWDKSTMRLKGKVPRLVPNSGFFGRMGLYEVAIAVKSANHFEVKDPHKLRAIAVTVGHFDPSCSELHLGSPDAGSIEITTTSENYEVSIAPTPVQVRRWRKWQNL